MGDCVVPFGCWEGAGAVVHGVVLGSRITDRLLPVVLRESAMV